MLTILNIEEKPYKGLLEKLKFLFKKEELIKSKVDNIKNIYVHDINYAKRSDDINWNKLSKVIGEESKVILCDKDLAIPSELKFKRFEPESYYEEICILFALEVLKESDIKSPDFNIALYDPLGEYSAVLDELIKYSSSINIITDNEYHYKKESDRIMEEYGANIWINRELNDNYFNLVLALHPIDRQIKTNRLSLVLTSRPYIYPIKGIIYDKYNLNKDINFKKFLSFDNNMSQEYIAAALYEIENKEDILNIIPSEAETWFGHVSNIEEVTNLLHNSIESQIK